MVSLDRASRGRGENSLLGRIRRARDFQRESRHRGKTEDASRRLYVVVGEGRSSLSLSLSRRLHAVGSSCLRDHERTAPVTSGRGKSGNWWTRHKEGTELILEFNLDRGKRRGMGRRGLAGRPGRTWISIRQSRGWIDNRLGGKISSLDTIRRTLTTTRWFSLEKPEDTTRTRGRASKILVKKRKVSK